MHPRNPPSIPEPTDSQRHGTRLKYKAGCRCLPCRAANARYEATRTKGRDTGGQNSLVSAEAARQHILKLSMQGVGRRALAAASDVAEKVIANIRSGKQLNIRRNTEERLLAINNQAPSDGALVRANVAWRQIRRLLAEGFSKAELARRLGYQSPSLQFGKTRIRARTAAQVDRLFRMLMKE